MVICAAMFVGCGEKETAVEPTESVVTETVAEATEEVTATEEIVEETEIEEVVEETEAETEQSTETSKSNKKDKTEASSESTETAAASEQEKTTASSSETASSGNESTATSSSDTPSNDTPSNDTASSGEIVYNGSLTLPSLGITIVYPNQYVSSGFSSNDILNNANAFTDALNNKYGTRAQGMTWFGNAYGFYPGGYNATPESQIKYNGDGTYTLIIGSHFGGGYQALISGVDITSLNADAILCELATMSSAPQSVYNGIYDILYGTTIYDANTWYTFGDCKVSYSPEGNDDPMDATLYLKKA